MNKNIFLKKLLAGTLTLGICCTSLGNVNMVKAQNNEANQQKNTLTDTTQAAVKADLLHNPVYNPEKGRLEFSYVYFGGYPQSEVTGEALTDAIVNAEYVSGEAVVDGVRYRRMKEEDAYYSFERWKVDNAENYSKEDLMEEERQYYYDWGTGDAYHYFRYEPIKWRVIEKEDGKALLLADSILEHRVYHSGSRKVGFGWEDSELRTWLNDYDNLGEGFAVVAFTEAEKQVLCDCYTEEKVVIPNNRYQVCDEVYILDFSELSEKGIKEPIDLQMRMSDYAYANGLPKQKVLVDGSLWDYKAGEQVGNWWLRKYAIFGKYVDYEGYFHCDDMLSDKEDAKYVTYAEDMTIGVCPAITLDLSNEELWDVTEPERREESIATTKPSEELVITSEQPSPSQDVSETTKPTESKTPIATDTPVNSKEPITTSKEPVNVSENPFSSSEEPKAIIYGDTDGNGTIDLADAQLTLKGALKIETLSQDEIKRADVIKDGVITLQDAQKVLRLALRIDSGI